MAEEEVELFIVAILFTVIFCFCLVLCHMTYLAYCPRCCGQHSSENITERTQAMFYVTEEELEMSECDQEGRRCSFVFITSN